MVHNEKEDQMYKAKKDMLNMIEDKGYSIDEAAEAVQPWYDLLTIEDLKKLLN